MKIWSNLTGDPAFWGFLGAVIYALPHLSNCWFTAREKKGSLTKCAIEAIIALIVGGLFAELFAGWLADFLKKPLEIRAIAGVLGMVANPIAPAVTSILSKRIIGRV